jgi:hypothetical protein
MLSLGCLPHWGREGVTLMATAENKRITGKRALLKPFTILSYVSFIEVRDNLLEFKLRVSTKPEKEDFNKADGELNI